VGGVGAVGEIISMRVKKALIAWSQLSYELTEADYARVQNSAAGLASNTAGGVMGHHAGAAAAAADGSGLLGSDGANDDDGDDGMDSLRLVSSEHVIQTILASLDRRLRPLKVCPFAQRDQKDCCGALCFEHMKNSSLFLSGSTHRREFRSVVAFGGSVSGQAHRGFDHEEKIQLRT
jgi:hypothetical protein